MVVLDDPCHCCYLSAAARARARIIRGKNIYVTNEYYRRDVQAHTPCPAPPLEMINGHCRLETHTCSAACCVSLWYVGEIGRVLLALLIISSFPHEKKNGRFGLVVWR